MKGKKHSYEVVVEFSTKADDKTKQPVFDKITKWFEDAHASVTKKDHLGVKPLVYKIKDFDKADFWQLDVEADKPVKLAELNVFLNRELQVIRYLVLKVPATGGQVKE
jgi:ribosomal protein S6